MSRAFGPKRGTPRPMKPLRILVLTQMFPPHHLGGYELACYDAVRHWRFFGHHVEVLTTTFRVPNAVDDPTDSTPVRRELAFYWNEHRIVKPSLRRRIQIEQANQRSLARALTELRPDVVSVWHMGAMSLGLLQTVVEHGLPIVLVVADEWLVYGGAVDAWTRLFAGRPRIGRIARKLTGLPTAWEPDPELLTACFASEWLRRRAIEHSKWRPGRTTVTFLGIDPRRFTRPDHSRPWSWRMLCTGRVEERKGVHVAIEALSHLPEGSLDVVGPQDDTYVAKLRRTAARLGVDARVRFVGAVGRDELPDLYRAADVFLFPVLWEEPFGLVPLEAMACGIPVVATGTGGSAEFLTDGANSLIVRRGDARDLAGAVGRLATDASLRDALVRGGHKTVAQLGTDQLVEVLEAWHAAAAAHFRHGVPKDRPAISVAAEPSASELDPDD